MKQLKHRYCRCRLPVVTFVYYEFSTLSCATKLGSVRLCCLMSSDVGCMSMVQYSFTSTETRRLVRTDSPGRPPRLSHSSWTRGGRHWCRMKKNGFIIIPETWTFSSTSISLHKQIKVCGTSAVPAAEWAGSCFFVDKRKTTLLKGLLHHLCHTLAVIGTKERRPNWRHFPQSVSYT